MGPVLLERLEGPVAQCNDILVACPVKCGKAPGNRAEHALTSSHR